LAIWRISVWLFGAFPFGCLAHFRLVVWRISVWLFGAFPFGYLAHSDMISAYINNPLFYVIYAFFCQNIWKFG